MVASRADPADAAGCLRTIEWSRDPMVSRWWRVEWVVKKRRRRLEDAGGGSAHAVAGGGGRIVALLPELNLYHGFEAGESDGYIDQYTNPPVDTWLAYGRGSRGGMRGMAVCCWRGCRRCSSSMLSGR